MAVLPTLRLNEIRLHFVLDRTNSSAVYTSQSGPVITAKVVLLIGFGFNRHRLKIHDVEAHVYLNILFHSGLLYDDHIGFFLRLYSTQR